MFSLPLDILWNVVCGHQNDFHVVAMLVQLKNCGIKTMSLKQFPKYSNKVKESSIHKAQDIRKQQAHNHTCCLQHHLSTHAAMADIRLCLKNVSTESQKWQVRLLCEERLGVRCGAIQFTRMDKHGHQPAYCTVFVDLDSDSWLPNFIAVFHNKTLQVGFKEKV